MIQRSRSAWTTDHPFWLGLRKRDDEDPDCLVSDLATVSNCDGDLYWTAGGEDFTYHSWLWDKVGASALPTGNPA